MVPGGSPAGDQDVGVKGGEVKDVGVKGGEVKDGPTVNLDVLGQ